MISGIVATEPGLAVWGVRSNGIDRLYLAGELDVSTAPILQRDLDAVVHRGGTLILDLGELTCIDWVGRRTLELAAKYASRDAWRLCIVNCSRAVRDAFETDGIDQLFSESDMSDLVHSSHGWSPISLPPLPGQRGNGAHHRSGRGHDRLA